MAGGAVAVVQFGDRAVDRHDVLRAAGVEVEQLSGGGLRDEQIGALRTDSRLGVGVAVECVGDALRVGTEQAVVEVALVGLRADGVGLALAVFGEAFVGAGGAGDTAFVRIVALPRAGGDVADGCVEEQAVAAVEQAAGALSAERVGENSWKSRSLRKALSWPSAPSFPSSSRPTWTQPSPRLVLSTRIPHGSPPAASGVEIPSRRTVPLTIPPPFSA